jgi:hypothetical protein
MPLAELTTPATPFESFTSMVRRMAVKIASHHDISVADTVAVSGDTLNSGWTSNA